MPDFTESVAGQLRDLQEAINQLPDRIAEKLVQRASGHFDSSPPSIPSEPVSPASPSASRLFRRRFQFEKLQPLVVATDRPRPDLNRSVSSPKKNSPKISPKLLKSGSSNSDLEGGGLLTKAFHTTVQAEAIDADQPVSAGQTASTLRQRRPSENYEKAALVAAAAQCVPLIGRVPSDPAQSRRPSNGSLQSPSAGGKRRPSFGTYSLAVTVPERRNSKTTSDDVSAALNKTGFERKQSPDSFSGVILPNVVENDDNDSTSSSDGSESSDSSALTDEQDGLSPKGKKTHAWHLAAPQGSCGRRLSLRSQSLQHLNLGLNFSRRNRFFRWWLNVFHPDGPVRFCWDALVTLTAVFLALSMPIIFAYFNQHKVPQPLSSLLLVADLSLILDVFVNFTTPWEDGPRIFVRPVEIASRYVQSWFCLDLVSIWPLGLGADPGSIAHRLHVLTKMTKCVKLMYLLPRCLKRFRSALTSYLKLLLPVLLFFHILACMWRCMTNADVDGQISSTLEGLHQDYVADLYWVLMTMSSVGYGDIVPQGISGRIFAIIVMFTSSLYGGFITSSMSHAMKRVFDDSAEAKVSDAVTFMITHKVPQDMQRRIALYLRKRVKDEMSLSKPSNLLSLLTPALQKELSMELLRSTLAAFPLFQNAPETFLAQLAQAHAWLEALAGDLVVEEGQVEQELVFVITGKLLVLKPGDPATIPNGIDESQLSAGSWFGEHCLFARRKHAHNHIREFTVMVTEDAELAVLTLQSFDNLMDTYPHMQKQLRKLTRAVNAGKLSLSELASA